jgi:hypothetical protein
MIAELLFAAHSLRAGFVTSALEFGAGTTRHMRDQCARISRYHTAICD